MELNDYINQALSFIFEGIVYNAQTKTNTEYTQIPEYVLDKWSEKLWNSNVNGPLKQVLECKVFELRDEIIKYLI
jgi:hypothetical protein